MAAKTWDGICIKQSVSGEFIYFGKRAPFPPVLQFIGVVQPTDNLKQSYDWP